MPLAIFGVRWDLFPKQNRPATSELLTPLWFINHAMKYYSALDFSLIVFNNGQGLENVHDTNDKNDENEWHGSQVCSELQIPYYGHNGMNAKKWMKEMERMGEPKKWQPQGCDLVSGDSFPRGRFVPGLQI